MLVPPAFRIFSAIVLCWLSNPLKIHPQPSAYALWRRLEKRAENMLIGVDQILELTANSLLEVTFSAILTKHHLDRGPLK